MPGEPSQSLQWLNMMVVSFGVASILAGLETLAEPFAWVGIAALVAMGGIYIEMAVKEYRSEEGD